MVDSFRRVGLVVFTLSTLALGGAWVSAYMSGCSGTDTCPTDSLTAGYFYELLQSGQEYVQESDSTVVTNTIWKIALLAVYVSGLVILMAEMLKPHFLIHFFKKKRRRR